MSQKTSVEFLQELGLIEPNFSEFFITKNNKRYSLNKILNDFADIKISEAKLEVKNEKVKSSFRLS